LSDLLCGVCGILDDPSVTLESSCERLFSKYLLVTAHLTALLTLLALAVDQYLAICRPLYHRSDVNISRVNVAIVTIWIGCLLCSSFEIILPVSTLLLIIFMVALCNRAVHYIFALWFPSSLFLLLFPCVISAVADWWMSTILPLMVWA